MAKTSKVTRLKSVHRQDGWANALTGIGTSLSDKRLGGEFAAELVSDDEAEELWLGDHICARAVEAPPEAMCREGFKVHIEDGGDEEEAAEARADEMEFVPRFQRVLEYERAYGGGALLLGADDGQRADRELNFEGLKSFNWMLPLSKRDLRVASWYVDARSPKFGQPETYAVRSSGRAATDARAYVNKSPVIHESRLITFRGIEVSRRRTEANGGWGDSIFVRIRDIVRDYQAAWAGASLLMADAGQRKFKMKGLAESIGSGRDDYPIKRAQLIEASRSICNAVIMDSEEDMEAEPLAVGGLAEMLDKFALQVASALPMPVTQLMGQAPAGLNATGDSDIRWWYDLVRSYQARKLKPGLSYALKVLFCSPDGPTGGVEPDNWSVSFPSLYQPTDAEKADVRLKTAQADQIYLANSAITPEEIATSRWGGDEYSVETVLDPEARARFEKAQAEIASADANALAPAGKTLPAGKGGGIPTTKGVKPGTAAAPRAKALPPGKPFKR